MKDEKIKKNFILYHSQYDILSELTDEEAGKLIKDIFEYSIEGTIPEYKKGTAMLIAFLSIKKDIDVANEKYQKRCEQNSKNARSKWKKIIYDNRIFLKTEYEEYAEKNNITLTFEEIYEEEYKLYFDREYEIIKSRYKNESFTSTMIEKCFL